MTIPTTQLWCRVSELDAARQEIRRLQQRVAELERQLAEAQWHTAELETETAMRVWQAQRERQDADLAALRLENTKLRRRRPCAS